jgi:iron-sulfur cluster assembly protein
MLSLTPNARDALVDLSARAGLPEEGGLRIVESPEAVGSFQLSLVEAPTEGDEVIEDDGARVFVEPLAATMLADVALDATTVPEGTGFLLASTERPTA